MVFNIDKRREKKWIIIFLFLTTGRVRSTTASFTIRTYNRINIANSVSICQTNLQYFQQNSSSTKLTEFFMNTYLGIMRWLWFKISGHVLFFGILHQVLGPIILIQTQEIHSVHSLNLSELFWVSNLALSKLFWLSNFCKNRVNNSSLKRIQRLCLNTAWSWLLLLIVPSIQEEEPPCSLLLHIYNEDDSILRRVYKDKGIATSRLYQQLSHHFLNFRNHYQFEQIWFWIKESVKQKRRFQISDHFESIWWFRKIVRDLRIKLVDR